MLKLVVNVLHESVAYKVTLKYSLEIKPTSVILVEKCNSKHSLKVSYGEKSIL